jgi:hypothetical protein
MKMMTMTASCKEREKLEFHSFFFIVRLFIHDTHPL